jgi:hypothetical protein
MMMMMYSARRRAPDLDDPLEDQVQPAAEIALHRARDDPDHQRARPSRSA